MPEKISNSPRIDWADFAKGLTMFTVIFGHAAVYNQEIFFTASLIAVYEFHMPFFFIMAGFLLNFSKWGGSENFRPFVTKLFWRLLVPYYLAEILWYPIWFVAGHIMGHTAYIRNPALSPEIAFWGIFVGNGNLLALVPLWFLPALFFAEIIFVMLWNRLNKFGAEIFVLAVVIFSCFDFNIKNSVHFWFDVDIALVALIFLLAGFLIRKYNFVDRIDLKICIVLTAILVEAFFFNEHIDINFRIYGNAFLFYAGGIAGSLLVMKISMLAVKVRGKFVTLIEDCGRQTMLILVLHPIIANIFYEIIVRAANVPPENLFVEPTIIFFTTIFGTLIPLWIAKRFGKLPVLKHFCA